jgi:hypothetical protein
MNEHGMVLALAAAATGFRRIVPAPYVAGPIELQDACRAHAGAASKTARRGMPIPVRSKSA